MSELLIHTYDSQPVIHTYDSNLSCAPVLPPQGPGNDGVPDFNSYMRCISLKVSVGRGEKGKERNGLVV